MDNMLQYGNYCKLYNHKTRWDNVIKFDLFRNVFFTQLIDVRATTPVNSDVSKMKMASAVPVTKVMHCKQMASTVKVSAYLKDMFRQQCLIR